jgi:hypothetical protein
MRNVLFAGLALVAFCGAANLARAADHPLRDANFARIGQMDQEAQQTCKDMAKQPWVNVTDGVYRYHQLQVQVALYSDAVSANGKFDGDVDMTKIEQMFKDVACVTQPKTADPLDVFKK